MTGRPRRSAAVRANEAITDLADSDRPMSRDRRSRGSGIGAGASVSRDPPSSPGDHLNLNIKVSSNKLRQATVGRDGVRTEQQISVNNGRSSPAAGESAAGRRSRGGRKSYVVESDSDEEDEELDLGDDDEDESEDDDVDGDGEEDADGEADEMELDADGDGEVDDDAGEDDADGDVDMDAEDSTITVSRPKGGSRAKPPSATNTAQRTLYEEDDDDDELSDPGPSDIEETITYGASAAEGDEDAEGEEEIEVAAEEDEEDGEGEEEEEEEEVELDSDGEPIRAETPDLSKMTRRQRARFEDTPQEHMKLSDEVQAKRVFTAEELSMRRSEMARRRRNLSDKRNEEVKRETINKLLKKQAPKTNKRSAADDESVDGDGSDPTIVRWVSDRQGSRLGLPEELVASRVGGGDIFRRPLKVGKMV